MPATLFKQRLMRNFLFSFIAYLLYASISYGAVSYTHLDNETIPADGTRPAVLKKVSGKWTLVEEIPVTEKYPSRYGGFKQAFDNRVVFVYATGGNKEENTWYQNKALFDAETFLYRGNGSIDVISDKDFIPSAYADRNVVLYGNASNNKAWNKLLKNAPIQVLKGEIRMGDKVLKGNDLGTYFG